MVLVEIIQNSHNGNSMYFYICRAYIDRRQHQAKKTHYNKNVKLLFAYSPLALALDVFSECTCLAGCMSLSNDLSDLGNLGVQDGHQPGSINCAGMGCITIKVDRPDTFEENVTK